MPKRGRNRGRKGATIKRGGRARGVWNPRMELSDSASYAGQQHFRVKLTGAVQLSAFTVTTGVVTQAYAVTAADIIGFATRFGSTFDEYRILGFDARVRPVGANSGVAAMWFDEKNTAAPTANEANERSLSLYSNSNAASNTQITLRWRAHDLLDLQYTPIGTTSVQPVTFKIYTDNANYGAPITAVGAWLVEPLYYVEFRGMKST
jgi:hypothetical protein